MEYSLSLSSKTTHEAMSVSTLIDELWVCRQGRALPNPVVSAVSTSSLLLVQGLPPVKSFLSNEFQISTVFLKDFYAFSSHKCKFQELYIFVQTSAVLFEIDFSFTF